MPGVTQTLLAAALGVLAATQANLPAAASDFSSPWKRTDRALVIDAYEYNEIDWQQLATDKRITGFIGKASDGLPPPYSCKGKQAEQSTEQVKETDEGQDPVQAQETAEAQETDEGQDTAQAQETAQADETEVRLCKALWKRYSVARELYHTRRMVARALGLEWGAYHLGRPGNPIDQANHFIDFAQPGPDDLVAIDIEDNDAEQWMSLEDAEEFARHIHRRIGRFPVLYTNGTTAQHIAANRDRYPLLSRLPLWYARYKPEIGMHFPKGNWQTYALWQFSAQTNCNEKECPYRVPGTGLDIDVNVASMSAEELREAWPFGGLVDQPADTLFSVPVPVAREEALKGEVEIAYVDVELDGPTAQLAEAYAAAGERYPAKDEVPADPARVASASSAKGDRYPAKAKAPADRGPVTSAFAALDKSLAAKTNAPADSAPIVSAFAPTGDSEPAKAEAPTDPAAAVPASASEGDSQPAKAEAPADPAHIASAFAAAGLGAAKPLAAPTVSYASAFYEGFTDYFGWLYDRFIGDSEASAAPLQSTDGQ